ncbi:MAG: tyrosine-type recombinase/integrase [Acidimicrobiales bacterium]
MSALAPVLQGFFTEYLAQRRASQHTVSSYRDTYRLVLLYAQEHLGKPPAMLDMADLDAAMVSSFLDHLEKDRGCSPRTRNLRLSAIHSLLSYASLRCPEHAETIRRALAIPAKRRDRTVLCFLTRAETAALLDAPDRGTALGQRDHLLLVVAVQSGLRVSELTGLTWADVQLGHGAYLHVRGKGRRERTTPLLPDTARSLQTWRHQRACGPQEPVFATRAGTRLSTDAVKDLLDKYVLVAAGRCPSIGRKAVTPHTMRHTCAMNLLQAGTDLATIALWLGHASTKSTDIYLHADLKLKEEALARLAPTPLAGHRYRPTDRLLEYLEHL